MRLLEQRKKRLQKLAGIKKLLKEQNISFTSPGEGHDCSTKRCFPYSTIGTNLLEIWKIFYDNNMLTDNLADYAYDIPVNASTLDIGGGVDEICGCPSNSYQGMTSEPNQFTGTTYPLAGCFHAVNGVRIGPTPNQSGFTSIGLDFAADYEGLNSIIHPNLQSLLQQLESEYDISCDGLNAQECNSLVTNQLGFGITCYGVGMGDCGETTATEFQEFSETGCPQDCMSVTPEVEDEDENEDEEEDKPDKPSDTTDTLTPIDNQDTITSPEPGTPLFCNDPNWPVGFNNAEDFCYKCSTNEWHYEEFQASCDCCEDNLPTSGDSTDSDEILPLGPKPKTKPAQDLKKSLKEIFQQRAGIKK